MFENDSQTDVCIALTHVKLCAAKQRSMLIYTGQPCQPSKAQGAMGYGYYLVGFYSCKPSGCQKPSGESVPRAIIQPDLIPT
jgi:hypothetical protein